MHAAPIICGPITYSFCVAPRSQKRLSSTSHSPSQRTPGKGERTCFQVKGAGNPSGFRNEMGLETPSIHSCSTGRRSALGSRTTVGRRGRRPGIFQLREHGSSSSRSSRVGTLSRRGCSLCTLWWDVEAEDAEVRSQLAVDRGSCGNHVNVMTEPRPISYGASLGARMRTVCNSALS
jgi:hypothetical protein